MFSWNKLIFGEKSVGINIKSVKEFIKSPFLFNQWYVAGRSDEFDRNPKSRTLLDLSIVFYRTEAGELNAMQNRCLHRAFPLSKGSMEGDNIKCGYHGACYNTQGEIVRIPGQTTPPPKKKLRKYPVKEVGQFVLIWMGEGTADMSKFPTPSISHYEDPNYRTIDGYYHIKGSYLFMQENLHDLNHVPILHAESFNIDERFLDLTPPLEETETERGVSARRVHVYGKDRFLPPSVLEAVQGKDLWRVDYGIAPAPGIYEAQIITGFGENEGDGDKPMNQYIMHFMTPETKTTCHYWWAVSLDHGTEGNDEFWQHFPAAFEIGFVEDVDACESMQTLLSNEQGEVRDVNFAADHHALMFRRVFAQWQADEYGD